MITKKNVLNDYVSLKKTCRILFEKGLYLECIAIIESMSKLAYSVNFIFADKEIDAQLKVITENFFDNKSNIVPIKGKYIFYDVFGWENRGLTQQYIRALNSWNIEFLYILDGDEKSSKKILEEINSFENADYVVIDQSVNRIERIKILYNIIADFKPEKAFLHMAPWSVESVGVWSNIENVTKYQINLTDHAFWLGSICFDYCIEFRELGYHISSYFRGIPTNKLIIQHYYPIVDKMVEFKGWPLDCSDKFIIFSGGSFYKVFGNDDIYFHISSQIIKKYPNALILFAGDGNYELMYSKIQKFKLEDKFILLGNRNDINEVFKHADMYLNTFPFGGGLMTYYAAINKIPQIHYFTNNQTLFNPVSLYTLSKDESFSFDNINDFFIEFDKLYKNKDYRKLKTDLLFKMVPSPLEFSKSLKNKIEYINNDYSVTGSNNIDTESITNYYLQIINENPKAYYGIFRSILSILMKHDKYQFATKTFKILLYKDIFKMISRKIIIFKNKHI